MLWVFSANILYAFFCLLKTQGPFHYSSVSAAQQLQASLGVLMVENTFDRVRTNLPQYTFYTSLVEQILHNAKKYGAPYKKVLKTLRIQLEHEIDFASKVRSINIQGYFQCALFSLVVFSFFYFAKKTMNHSFLKHEFLIILMLQSLGVLCFYFLGKFFYRTQFFFYPRFYLLFFHYSSLLPIGVPLNYIADSFPEREFLLSPGENSWRDLKERFDLLLLQAQREGSGIHHEIILLCEQLRFRQKREYQRFHKRHEAVKTAVLLTFFMGSYFMALFFLINAVVTSV